MSVATKDIRNVVLLGHSGSGKTTFAETMLFESGAIKRKGSVDNQNTVSDYSNIEKERGNSFFSTLMHVNWRGNKINIIDTPGYDDFVGEVVSSLKVADTAAILLNASSGVEVGTEILWEYVEQFSTPAIFIINQMDHDKANYETTLEQAKERFGPKVIPVQYPYNSRNYFDSIIDVLRMVMYVFHEKGGKPEKRSIPSKEMPKAMALHIALVEAAAENEDGLMEKYFDQGTLDESDLAKGLTIALANQEIYPVFIASSTKNMGSGRIMGFINDIAPSPADRPAATLENGGDLVCSTDNSTSIFIYKTLTEPQVGQVSYFKVYSGTLSSGDDLINSANSEHERINQLYVAEGKERTAVPSLSAGDIGVTVKLKNTHSNNTLNAKGVNRSIEPIHFPSSRFRTAVSPPSKSDMEKLIKALHIIEKEDPTMIIEQSAQLKQTILHGQGQLHLDIVKYRLEKVNGITMNFEKPRIPYRETITRGASTHYRHKKQSGGSGQFGEVHMRIEPYYEDMSDPVNLTVRKKEIEELPWGGKLAFYWCIVGGSIDAKYSNAIKKGVMQKMEEGPLTGSYCQNIRVCIYDGKMHAVDSNDMAFMLASSAAFKSAFKDAGPQVMEPIYDMEILCSDTVMGDVMGDLQTRRAAIQGMDSVGHYQKIMAKVPLAELYKYSSTLRSISQGKAKFSRVLSGFQPVPYSIQEELMQTHSALEEA
ncbi:MAG: elongation factor G [Halioglobus sp.]|jgi:elongation factor G